MSVELPPAFAIIEDLASHPELYRDDQLEIAAQLAAAARERLSQSESRTADGYRRRRDPARIEITEGRVDVHVDLVHPNARYIEFVDRGRGRVGPLAYALRVLGLS